MIYFLFLRSDSSSGKTLWFVSLSLTLFLFSRRPRLIEPPSSPQFGCGQYPAHDKFLASIKVEAEQVVTRLRDHPSVVIFVSSIRFSLTSTRLATRQLLTSFFFFCSHRPETTRTTKSPSPSNSSSITLTRIRRISGKPTSQRSFSSHFLIFPLFPLSQNQKLILILFLLLLFSLVDISTRRRSPMPSTASPPFTIIADRPTEERTRRIEP